MKNISSISPSKPYLTRIALLAVLLVISSLSLAQGVVRNSQIATIQNLQLEAGQLTMSGRIYTIDFEVTKIFLNGIEERPPLLAEGMVVRFTLTPSGILERMEVLGPAYLLDELNEDQ